MDALSLVSVVIALVTIIGGLRSWMHTSRAGKEAKERLDSISRGANSAPIASAAELMTGPDHGVDAIVTTTTGAIVVEAKAYASKVTANDVRAMTEHIRRQYEKEALRVTSRLLRQIERRYTVGRRSNGVLQVWSAFLPQRINDEVLGDYLEDLHRRVNVGQSRWVIYLRVMAAMFWTGANTVGYFFKAIGRSKSTN